MSSAEQAGQRPSEGDLLRLADAQQRTGNNAGYSSTLEKLLTYYPKKDYWNAHLSRLPRKPGFGDRFALDVMRLRLASGTLAKTEDFMEMAQLSLQAGLAGEGRRIVDQGYKAGVLGTGAEAARHQRLKDLAVKQETELKAAIAGQAAEAEAQKDGNDLVKVGYAYVSLGDVDRGIALIEKGIAKGGLKRPEDAKLRLGMAQQQSPKFKAKATQTLAQRGRQRRRRRHRTVVDRGRPGQLMPVLQHLGGGVHVIDTGFHRDDFDAAYLVVRGGRAAFIDTGTNFARYLSACWARWTHSACSASRSTTSSPPTCTWTTPAAWARADARAAACAGAGASARAASHDRPRRPVRRRAGGVWPRADGA